MLDYKFIKEHLAEVKENIRNRNMAADADAVVRLYDRRPERGARPQPRQPTRQE
ncbi:MAG: serine--tRNA ligase, partial [Treponemataceae bacterium]|nr:serine--tRNA ligase [Treponemataceae bacterium]